MRLAKDSPAVGDSTLVARAKDGDREALGELLSRHERAMLAIARAYFASDADAEDAVQEASATACRSLDQLRDDGRFAGWLAAITRNACLQILRTRKDKQSLADFATSVQLHRRVGPTPLTPAALAQRQEGVDCLRIAIGRLSEDYRVAIMLRYSEDMSYDQIAAYLDVPLATVRNRLHRAKRALEEMLESLETPTG